MQGLWCQWLEAGQHLGMLTSHHPFPILWAKAPDFPVGNRLSPLQSLWPGNPESLLLSHCPKGTVGSHEPNETNRTLFSGRITEASQWQKAIGKQALWRGCPVALWQGHCLVTPLILWATPILKSLFPPRLARVYACCCNQRTLVVGTTSPHFQPIQTKFQNVMTLKLTTLQDY